MLSIANKAFTSVVMLNVTTMNVVAPFLTAVASQVKLVPRFLVEKPFPDNVLKGGVRIQMAGLAALTKWCFGQTVFNRKTWNSSMHYYEINLM
jgi:hypothetical protein